VGDDRVKKRQEQVLGGCDVNDTESADDELTRRGCTVGDAVRNENVGRKLGGMWERGGGREIPEGDGDLSILEISAGGRSFKTMSMGLSVAKLGCESSSAKSTGLRNPSGAGDVVCVMLGVGILMSMLLDLRVGTGGCTTAERDGAG